MWGGRPTPTGQGAGGGTKPGEQDGWELGRTAGSEVPRGPVPGSVGLSTSPLTQGERGSEGGSPRELKLGASRKQRLGWNICVDMARRLLAMLASLGPTGPFTASGASGLARGGSRAGDRVPSSSPMSSRSDRDSWLFISESVSASKAVPPPSRLLSEPLSEPSLARAESRLESESKPSLRSLSSPALGRWRRRRRQDRRENFRLLLSSPA